MNKTMTVHPRSYILFLTVCAVFCVVCQAFAANTGKAMTTEEVKAALEQKRQQMIELDKEKQALIQEKASTQVIMEKTKEIMTVREEALELFEKIKPSGPPKPVSASEIAPEEAKKIETLIQERRQKIVKGAGSKEISDLTEEIQAIHLSIINQYRKTQASHLPPAAPSPEEPLKQ
ncbi:MAG: hypothetical protein COV74_06605 [Candidatus Omnitrophica bacterium CG11_big_fil_rev_8_21_14_0_20_45_26]|uniref:Uncharacterized protein n=1 Tax=Candidatus Abzuiibacterium crystallinum TaxID=1974748 RepID=A0A2H0LNS6_9BACT|nr:MAG: hypothetical protein COV74_06605 [Candidatus Omnitrophica bacterium CG11_big_fil_rev_8_21_14_0_20_45_26]PIW64743.1 MAG: hypothetical protein COW12_05000 [Candidatus Omnitrophica bacterium CG12_big_fil_rev_8_21_14_0_65_45_16]